jgi:hypothetical protein
MELTGKIIVISDTEQLGNNGFTKRQLVIETAEQYPQKIAIDFVKDKCAILEHFKLNDNVTVAINLRGSEYKGKYYVNIQGWKIAKNSNDIEVLNAEVISENKENNDLPF